jgi:hypothetical protein
MLSLLSPLVLTGCAQAPFYESRAGARVANLRVLSAMQGGAGYVVGLTYVANNAEVNDAAGFTPHAGHTYEIVFGLNEGKPELHLFEMGAGDSGQVKRMQLPFDLGSLRCRPA